MNSIMMKGTISVPKERNFYILKTDLIISISAVVIKLKVIKFQKMTKL